MKKNRMIASLIMACVLCVSISANVSADSVDMSPDANPAGSASTKIELVKEAAPAYTVTIPETLTLSEKSAELKFSMNLDSHEAVPSGKRLAVTIEQAGNPSGLAGMESFCLVSENHDIAPFMLYYSDRVSQITPYEIGDEIVTWEAGNWGTQTRMAKMTDYDAVKPGTYEGSIVFGISMTDHTFE